MLDYKINTLEKRAVADNYYWRPIHTCPIGVKVLLLSSGTCILGPYTANMEDVTHWAPLPRVPKDYLITP